MDSDENSTRSEPIRDKNQETEKSSRPLDDWGARNFSEVMSLISFKNRVVAEGPLWQVLVDAIQEVLQVPTPMTQPVHGLIVADHPLLGLAAAQLFAAPDIGVPLERHAVNSRTRLSQAVALHGDLGEFVDATRTLTRSAGPLLMLGWNATGITAAETALAEAERVPALAGGLIWLIHKDGVAPDMGRSPWGSIEPIPVLANVVDRARDILQQTLLGLRQQLPEFIDVSSEQLTKELIDWMLQEHRLGQIFDALNTPSLGAFQRLVSQREKSEQPQQSKDFENRVLSPREEFPRHAASLFLVSHFPDLTPAQFIELGDSLADCTAAFQVGSRRRRPPATITDVVLSECHISFVKPAQGQATAVLGSRQGREDSDPDPLGVRAAEHMRRQFDLQAPLLKERYLRYLDTAWLLGHASDKIANQYRDLVVVSLRADNADDRQLPGKRLRRVVYGPPWSLSEEDSTDKVNRRMEALVRSIGRTPELIEAFVGAASNDQLHEAVAVLCDSDLFTSEHESRPLIRYASAGVFWLIYAYFRGRLSLRAFPSLFSREVATDEQRRLDGMRRLDCLNQLRKLLPWGSRQPAVTDMQPSWLFTSPPALAMLVSDLASCYRDIVGNGQEWVDVALLAEAGSSYLRQTLRYSTWLELAAWGTPGQQRAVITGLANIQADDLELARALMDGRFEHWLLHPEQRPPESDGTDPYSPQRTPLDEGRLQRRIVHTVLDALVGLRGFGPTEAAAINIWFRRALNLPPVAVYFIAFFDESLWTLLCTPTEELNEQPERKHHKRLIEEALTPVIRLFPVFLLMAATRDPATTPSDSDIRFKFSSAMVKWLATQPKNQPSPAQRLLSLIDQGQALQEQWKQSHDDIWMAVDLDWGRIAAAMQDREDALIAFAEALDPIASNSQPAPETETSNGQLSSRATP